MQKAATSHLLTRQTSSTCRNTTSRPHKSASRALGDITHDICNSTEKFTLKNQVGPVHRGTVSDWLHAGHASLLTEMHCPHQLDAPASGSALQYYSSTNGTGPNCPAGPSRVTQPQHTVALVSCRFLRSKTRSSKPSRQLLTMQMCAEVCHGTVAAERLCNTCMFALHPVDLQERHQSGWCRRRHVSSCSKAVRCPKGTAHAAVHPVNADAVLQPRPVTAQPT
jgi:hypothetical protein